MKKRFIDYYAECSYRIKKAVGSLLLYTMAPIVIGIRLLYHILPNSIKGALMCLYANLYGSILLLYYLLKGCVVVLIPIAIIALTAIYVFPKQMEKIDSYIVRGTVDDLVKHHHYQQTIYLLESKRYLLKNEINDKELSKILFVCYSHIGEYSKAENICWKAYKGEDSLYVALYDLYKKMGDEKGMADIYGKIRTQNKNSKYSLEIADQIFETQPYSAIEHVKNVFLSTTNDNTKYKSLCQLIHFYANLKIKDASKQYVDLASNNISEHGFVEKFSSLIPQLIEDCVSLGFKERAEHIAVIAKNEMSNLFSEDDLDYAMLNFACVRFFPSKDNNQNFKDIEECCRAIRKNISSNIIYMSNEQRDFYLKKLESPFGFVNRMFAKNNTPQLAELYFINYIFRYGLLLRSENYRHRLVEELQDSKAKLSYDSLLSVKRELSMRQNVSGIKNLSATLRLQINQKEQEKKISENLYVNTLFLSALQMKSELKDVVESLDKDDALLVYTDIEDYLYAFTMTIDAGVNFVKIKRNKQYNYVYHEHSDIWDSVSALLENKKNIYYMTNENTNLVLFPSLLTKENKMLIDTHNLVLVSNPMELETIKSDMNHSFIDGDRVCLWGGINYNSVDAYANIKTNLDALSFLNGSKSEVEAIKTMFSKAIVYNGVLATEKSFKERSGKKDKILHVSTHGFYDENKNHTNLMNNCGLIFAGANNYTSNKILSEDDGILRGYEIENMDLTSCDLVVLSACETGLGSYDRQEGVFGLQRAFKLAGAKFILMSLDNVNDRLTKELMVSFYSNLKKGEHIDIAFKNAQKKLMNGNPTQNKEWAKFVLLH